jgi:type II secretory pathway pseudopilin PulG
MGALYKMNETKFLLQYGRRKKGFILIAVLLVLSLLTITVVSSLIIASTELQATYNNRTASTARLNALFALNVALGQLQREAGPDQRTTARAEILTGASGPKLANYYWTGVWKTYNPAWASSPPNVNVDQQLDTGNNLRNWATNPSNVAWLVSNPGSTPVLPSTWSGSTTAGTAVTLAFDQSASPPTVIAQVPTVPVTATVNGTNKAVGKYAYWVSDEGVKSKANMIDSTINLAPQVVDASLNYTQNLLHFLAPQSDPQYQGLPSTLNYDFRSNPALSRVTTTSALRYIPPLDSPPQPEPTNFYPSHVLPWVTTSSLGVLADVRNGGLKRDLTAAFEDSGNTGQYNSNFPANGAGGTADTQSVYRATTAIPPVNALPFNGNAVLDGLRWQNLYFYYNLYKQVEPLTRAGTGASPAGMPPAEQAGLNTAGNLATPYTIESRAYGWSDNGNNFVLDQITPLMIGYRMEVTLVSTLIDPTNNIYNLSLCYHPELVLYNPYSFQLTFPSSPVIGLYTNALSDTWKKVIKFLIFWKWA